MKTIILGVNGKEGNFFSAIFFEEKLHVTGIDLHQTAKHPGRLVKYICWDLTQENVHGSISLDCDLLIMCLPEQVACKFLESNTKYISLQTLIIDTLSIKHTICNYYLANKFAALSINPMFGPDLNPYGKAILIVKINESHLSGFFLSLLIKRELRLKFLEIETHDKIVSYIQCMVHFLLIGFGISLKEINLSFQEQITLSSPPFLTLLSLFGRISIGNPQLYWEIQKGNQYSSFARKLLIKKLLVIDKIIDNNEENNFNDLLNLKDDKEKMAIKDLAETCLSIFQNAFKEINIT